MNRFISIIICAFVMFGTTGCGGNSKSPEDTLKTIYEYTDKTLIEAGGLYDDYWDLMGNCYNHNGIQKTCDRIKGEIGDSFTLKIMKDDDVYIDVITNIDGTIAVLTYTDTRDVRKMNYYFANYQDNLEIVHLGNDEPCDYFLNGKDESIDENSLCDASRKTDAKNIKDDFEKMLSEIGITEKELKEFASWYAKNDGKKLIAELKEKKKNQKSLTNEEINNSLSKDFQFTKLDNDSIYLEHKIGDSSLMFLAKTSDHQDAVAFQDSLFDNITLYIYKDGRYIAINNTKTCDYSLNDKTTIKHSDCSTDTIHNMEMVKSHFDTILNEHGITLEELFNFFINYK